MQLNPQQQQNFAIRMNEELSKITMSWNNALKSWYPIAIEALRHASVLELRVQQAKYGDLFDSNDHGVNLTTVMVLSNNLEARSPAQMGVGSGKWREILDLNTQVAKDWEGLAAPVRNKLIREFELMNGKVGGMRIIKAEA